VRGKPYGLAVWLSAYLGLRVGEVQALRWEDVDLETGVIHIRRTYTKHEGTFRDYPKGRKQHSHRAPAELLAYLSEEKANASTDLVIVPEGWKMLCYWMYRKGLKRYCQEAGVPVIATHGLRHSTSELYQTYGASREDLRQLFAHSSVTTTERYIHHKGDSLEKVAKVIQLFPNNGIASTPSGFRNDDGSAECSQNVPISNSESKGVDRNYLK
jgi:integrase